MKCIKSVTVVLVCLVLLFIVIGCDGAADINSFSLAQPDHEYEIDTWGSNSEIYEFTPRNNTDYTCVMFMLDNGSDMGLQCFPKKVVKSN